MVSMESRLNARIDGAEVGLKAYIDQRCERVETPLLTEFHEWAGPLDMRVKNHSAALRVMNLELESLSGRVQKLENPGQQS
jgi:hypothetical protein